MGPAAYNTPELEYAIHCGFRALYVNVQSLLAFTLAGLAGLAPARLCPSPLLSGRTSSVTGAVWLWLARNIRVFKFLVPSPELPYHMSCCLHALLPEAQ